jgi:ATP-dependent exoDNAse (exonuclease V) beta subunit
MALIFEPESHTYLSQDQSDKTIWTSVTTLLSHLKQPFNANKIAVQSSKKSKSKWFGLTPEQIQEIWKAEAKRATDLGSWYHDQREADIIACSTITRYDSELPVIRPLVDDNNRKIASSQKLIDGIYPEHLVYLRSAGICGQSDLVEVVNGYVHIIDYKTNKKIETESYVDWEGFSKKMLHPVSHLDDCNYNHYNLQLSIYMYMILKHNPKLKPGKIIIHHILFETEDETDQWGYPIHKKTEQGDFIVKDIIPYEMPYLKEEVISILTWYKENASQILNSKKK